MAPVPSSNRPSPSRSHARLAMAVPSGSVAVDVSVIDWPGSGVASEIVNVAAGCRPETVKRRRTVLRPPSASVTSTPTACSPRFAYVCVTESPVASSYAPSSSRSQAKSSGSLP